MASGVLEVVRLQERRPQFPVELGVQRVARLSLAQVRNGILGQTEFSIYSTHHIVTAKVRWIFRETFQHRPRCLDVCPPVILQFSERHPLVGVVGERLQIPDESVLVCPHPLIAMVGSQKSLPRIDRCIGPLHDLLERTDGSGYGAGFEERDRTPHRHALVHSGTDHPRPRRRFGVGADGEECRRRAEILEIPVLSVEHPNADEQENDEKAETEAPVPSHAGRLFEGVCHGGGRFVGRSSGAFLLRVFLRQKHVAGFFGHFFGRPGYGRVFLACDLDHRRFVGLFDGIGPHGGWARETRSGRDRSTQQVAGAAVPQMRNENSFHLEPVAKAGEQRPVISIFYIIYPC
ncbi:MAG: hypothetical protein BWY66_02939 [bacterium ADurb.Bin374]|nr:MAG: hypothetical protein BWY66_02939 [bacterium ADurb.Bin374]